MSISQENFRKIFDFFLETYAKWFYLKEKWTEWWENTPFSSVIAFILQNTNETLQSLKKLTWEEINFISEWIIYNMNEQTKEWKELNKKNQAKKDIKDGKYDNTLGKLRKNREKIMAKFNNKK